MVRSRVLLPLLFVFLASVELALADLYGYVDEQGRAHFSTVPLGDRYQLFKRTIKDTKQSTQSEPVTANVDVPKIPGKIIKRYKKEVAKAAKKYALDPALIHAVISAESQYDAQAISERGAVGLMQLMPDTAERYKVANALDPQQNIGGGSRYLRDLLRLFNGDLELAIAAYNAGENAVLRHGRKIPPYPQTVRYVPKVLTYYRRYQQAAI
jgi:soluble lytic murein transglycosylase-like protein